MLRLEDNFQSMRGTSTALSSEDFDKIGFTLIKNYGGIEKTAKELGMAPVRLRHLLHTEYTLQVYFQIAQEGIKSLTDEKIIEGLVANDPDMVRMVATRLYSGRNRGGFNISEIGTTGYKDKIGKEIAEETAADRKQGAVRVEFNFIRKDVVEHQAVGGSEYDNVDAVDGEFEDIDPQ